MEGPGDQTPQEPTDHTQPSSNEQTHEEHAAKKRQMPHWLRHLVISWIVINAATIVVDKVAEKETRERIRHANEAFVRSVEQVDPFRLAKTYWNFVWHDTTPTFINPQPVQPHIDLPPTNSSDPLDRKISPFLNRDPLPTLSNPADLNKPKGIGEKIGGMFGRAISGVVWTFVEACSSGGPVSIVVTVIALVFAYVVLTGGGEHEVTIVHWVLTPFVASFFVWILLIIMRVAGALFHGVLDMAEMLAAINSFFLGTFWNLGEHHFTTSIITRLSGKHGPPLEPHI